MKIQLSSKYFADESKNYCPLTLLRSLLLLTPWILYLIIYMTKCNNCPYSIILLNNEYLRCLYVYYIVNTVISIHILYLTPCIIDWSKRDLSCRSSIPHFVCVPTPSNFSRLRWPTFLTPWPIVMVFCTKVPYSYVQCMYTIFYIFHF